MEFKELLDYVVVPLFLWIWYTDRKVTRLEATQITKGELQKIHERLDLIFLDNHKNKD